MRLVIAAVAALLLVPAATAPSLAGDAPALRAAPDTDVSAARKKAKKSKAEKVEYMRAVPSK